MDAQDIEAGFGVADLEQMTVVFPARMAAQIRAAVEAGEYASTSEAVRDAVQLWSDRRQPGEDDPVRLRQAWDAGKAGGRYGPINFDELRKDARDRLARHKSGDAGWRRLVEVGSR